MTSGNPGAWKWRFILAMPILALLADCAGLGIPPFSLSYYQSFLLITFGWLGFLARVLPAITVDWFSVGLAGMCLVGLTIGLHAFGGWLYRETATRLAASRATADEEPEPIPPWRLRTTLSLIGLFVLMFVGGTAAVGGLHQIAWAPFTR